MSADLPPFSVLLSIYHGTRAGEFSEALESVARQTTMPQQIVTVFDGRVAEDVVAALDAFELRYDITISRLLFSENRGLGPALADGVEACDHELVARIDTDDISTPDRFATQLQEFDADKSLDVLGGWLEERADIDEGSEETRIRHVPESSSAIRAASRFRNPLNHPTVMFRRSRVLDAGNYRDMLWFEDYELWARMLLKGCYIRNLPRVLVIAQADRDYFSRRGGLRYLRQEFRLATRFRQTGFHSLTDSLRFLGTRTLFRLIPNASRGWMYARVLRNNAS